MGTRRCVQAIILILGLSLAGSVLASGAIGRQQWRDYDWPVPASANAQPVSRVQTSLDWVDKGIPASPAFHYDYQPLRVRSGSPAHNGHLHRLSVAVEKAPGQWRMKGRVGLHGTSNIFKHGDLHREALVGKVVLWRQLENLPVNAIGIGGDHRFGHFRWIPRVLWEDSVAGHHLRLDPPRGLYWQGPGRCWRFRAERLGDKWGALDADRDLKSAIYLEEWQLLLSRRFPVSSGGWFLELGLGMSLDTRVRYRETDGREVRRDLGNAGFGLVKLGW